MEKVIYEKKYPKEDLDDLEGLPEACGEPEVPFEEFLKQMCEDFVYVLIPSRQKAARAFIRLAREISELYQLDIKITQRTSHISVDFYFNSAARMKYMKEIVAAADDVAFFANIFGYEINLCLDFYTHAVYQNGRQIMP